MEANTKAMMSSVESLVSLKEKLKLAQQDTEDIFMNSGEDDLKDCPNTN